MPPHVLSRSESGSIPPNAPAVAREGEKEIEDGRDSAERASSPRHPLEPVTADASLACPRWLRQRYGLPLVPACVGALTDLRFQRRGQPLGGRSLGLGGAALDGNAP